MENEYKTICDTCSKRTWYKEEQQCHMERCTGTLRVIDNINVLTHYITIGERYTFQDLRGTQKRFTVGKTTGRKPCLLLLHNSRSMSSSITIKAPEIEPVGNGIYKVNTYFD